MEPLQTTAQRALRSLLSGQPTDAAKVAFAWQIVTRGPMGRATTSAWSADDRVLRIRASSPEWRREVERSRPLLAARLKDLLGAGVIRSIVVDGGTAPGR